MRAAERASARTSATFTASQMPSMPMSAGRRKTQPSSNTRVRVKEMTADTGPLLRAVNQADANMLNPQIRKESMYSRVAWMVRSRSARS